MTHAKSDAMTPEEAVEAEDPERRNLARALLGAVGAAAFLEACGSEAGPLASDSLGQETGALTGTNVTWVDAIGTAPVTGTNLNLRGKVGSNSAAFAVALGFATRGDGGGGIFAFAVDSASKARTDDGGTIIVPNTSAPVPPASGQSANSAGQTGCWKRIYSGPLDVTWFGADTTGTADAATAVLRAIAALPATGGTVHFPPGTFLLAKNLSISKNNVKLIGAGVGATIVKDSRAYSVHDMDPPPSLAYGLFSFNNVAAPEVAFMTLDGNWQIGVDPRNNSNPTVTTRKGLFARDCPDTNYHDIEARGFFSEALYVDGNSPRTTMRGNYVHDCSLNAFNIGSSSPQSAGSSIIDNSCVNCPYSAIQVSAFSCVVSRNHIRQCGGYGADVVLCDGVTLLSVTDNVISECNISAGGVSLIALMNTHPNVTNALIARNVIGKNTTGSVGATPGAPIFVNFLPPNQPPPAASGAVWDSNIVIEGNHVFESGPASGGPARAIGVSGPITGRVLITGNTIRSGATAMTTGIKLFVGIPDPNGIEIGPNYFDVDIAVTVDYGVRPARATTRASRPSAAGLQPGYTYFETQPGVNKPLWWDGANWRDATGALA